MPAGHLGQYLGQLAGQLDSGGAGAADHHGRQAALPLGVGGGRGSRERLVDRLPHLLGVAAEYSDSARWARPGMAKS